MGWSLWEEGGGALSNLGLGNPVEFGFRVCAYGMGRERVEDLSQPIF